MILILTDTILDLCFFSDASVPSAMKSTMCCYGKGAIPKPGDGVSINVSTGFCHEPDHLQLEIGNTSVNETISNAVSNIQLC